MISGTKYGIRGITAAILTAAICEKNPSHSIIELIREFFDTYSSLDWHQPIKSGGTFECLVPSPVRVYTHVEPLKNTADNVTMTKLNIIKREFQRARNLISNDSPLPTITAKFNLCEEYNFLIAINFDPENFDYFKNAGYNFTIAIENNSKIKMVQISSEAISKNEFCRSIKMEVGRSKWTFESFFIIGLQYLTPGDLKEEIKQFEMDHRMVSKILLKYHLIH
jgi:hypothetical protein